MVSITGIEGRGLRGYALLAAVATLTLIVILLAPRGAQAEAPGCSPLISECPPFLTDIGEGSGEAKSGAGQLFSPRGIATNPATGHVYMAETGNNRVSEFTSWGAFVKAWGWGVADGSAELQTCGPAQPETSPPPGSCQAGISGGGAGQLAAPGGIVVDGDGNLWLLEYQIYRVQKFSPAGEFLLMIGGEVNKTTTGDICTKANLEAGNVCGVGVPGSGPGEFAGVGPFNNQIAASPSGTIYVGDENRIQEFSTSGVYLDEIGLPGSGGTRSLTVDPDGDIYAISNGIPGVRKISAAGVVLGTLEGEFDEKVLPEAPVSLGSDAAGNIYVVDSPAELGNPKPRREVLAFDPDGNLISFAADRAGFAAPVPTNKSNAPIAVTTNLLGDGSDTVGNIYVGYFDVESVRSYVRVYGPPPQFEPPPPADPRITAQFATSVDSTGATLRAQINPVFWADATYHLQYGTSKCSEGGCDSQAPATPAALGGGQVNVAIATGPVSLVGLVPNTTYYYRFVAESGGGGPVFGVGGKVGQDGTEGTFRTFPEPIAARPCGNDAFRIGPSAGLPDCRAYEMVSPIDKSGGDIVTGYNSPGYRAAHEQGAAAGDKLTFSASQAFPDSEAGPYTSQYIATRHAGEGWSTQSISPLREGSLIFPISGLDTQFKAFSTDLSRAWLLADSDPGLDPGASIPGYGNLYRRDNEHGSYQAQCSITPPNRPPDSFFPEVQGFSADGSHTVFRANDKLNSKALVTTAFQLYECVEGVELRLVGLLPGGTASPAGSSAGIGQGEPMIGHRLNNVDNAVSEDGSRIFWTAASEGEAKIYVRIDGTQTLPVSAAAEVLAGSASSRYSTAAADGSKALFTTGGRLFEFDVDEEETTQIAAGVKGVVGASEDASDIYFISTQVLDGAAANGKPNLYLYEAEGGGGFTFIATVSDDDARAATKGDEKTPILSPANGVPFKRSSRVTPDGRHLAFMSSAPLTGYDNTDVNSGQADAEVFLYDADGGSLVCVSCNPTGARPIGENIADPNDPFWAAGKIPGWENQHYAPRVLSDDGRRLYFETLEALVLSDSNGRQDVYQWEALGTGSCDGQAPGFSADTGGCIGLISSGESRVDSEFVDASVDGLDVFFKTDSRLLRQDPGQTDIYDARQNGGLPSPPLPGPECEGEACQSPPLPPALPTSSSSTFRGPGDPRPRRDCTALRLRSMRLAGRARRLAGAAERTELPQRAAAQKRRARQLEDMAKRQEAKAKRCRLANRRAGR